MLVSYRRKYFVIGNIRITLDTDLKFINLAKINFFSKSNFLCINKKKIVELKYGDKFHHETYKITEIFNNRLSKFSKYQIFQSKRISKHVWRPVWAEKPGKTQKSGVFFFFLNPIKGGHTNQP